MLAATSAGLLVPAENRIFHLIRLASLSTFPSRGRLEKRSPFYDMWFFDSLKIKQRLLGASVLSLSTHPKKVQYSQTLECRDQGKADDKMQVTGFVAKGVHGQKASRSAAQQSQQEQPGLRHPARAPYGPALVAAHYQKGHQAHETEPEQIETGSGHLRFFPPGRAFFLGLALAQPFLLTGFLTSGWAAGALALPPDWGLPFPEGFLGL